MPALAHPRKLSLFAVLSLADLALTCFLLGRPGGGAYEWNPVASWWLVRFGWAGLAGFKLGIILLIAILILAVSRNRPRAAERLLAFGCAALLAVIVYSGSLVRGVQAEATQFEQLLGKTQELDRDLTGRIEFSFLLQRVRSELTDRRCTLAEAVEILADSEYVRNGSWSRVLGPHFPGRTTEERLAAQLVHYILILASEFPPDEAAWLAYDLDAQFRSYFGCPAPNLSGPRDEAAADAT
jgi:hypothetical protein